MKKFKIKATHDGVGVMGWQNKAKLFGLAQRYWPRTGRYIIYTGKKEEGH